MSVLGASRFTALLAAIAISGMAGTFWWALETRPDMKAAAGHQGASRALPPKFTGRVTRAKDERPGKPEPSRSDPGKSDSGKFELMGRSEQPLPASVGSAGRSDDQDAAAGRSMSLLANYPAGPALAFKPQNSAHQGAGFQSRSTQISGLQVPNMQAQGTQAPDAQVSGAVAPSQVAAVNRADMPLPALSGLPPVRPPEPASWQQTMSPDLPAPLPFTAAAAVAENPKRHTRSSIPVVPAAARPPKPQAQSYYMEKYLEQGEYRLRRRPCEPPNMPDVCFMPQADRQPVLAAKP
jgi:hypothetical protein